MIIIHDCEQGSEEWKNLRCGSLGASRVKDAMAGGAGKSRKTLAYQLAAESVTGAKTEFRVTPAMQQGIDTEPEARAYFEFFTGLEVKECGLITNDEMAGVHASPDGLIGSVYGLEIKCPLPATHAKYLVEGRLPPEYKAQVMFSMLVSERPGWYFVSYHPAFARQLVIKVDSDTKYTEAMMDKLALFMGELEAIKEKIQ